MPRIQSLLASGRDMLARLMLTVPWLVPPGLWPDLGGIAIRIGERALLVGSRS